jgi:hydrogenase expression/formation protein HypC
MCVAVPAKILAIQDSLARVELGGVERSASLQLTPEAKPGDYVLIHAGFAIQVLDEQEAKETLDLFQELAALESGESRGKEPKG